MSTKKFDLMSLAPDQNMAEEGVWIDFFEDSKLKIAQAQNSKHQAFINVTYKQHRRKLDIENKAADDLAETISIEGYARHVLRDWSGITVNGKDEPYSPELAMELMVAVPLLRKEVEEQSRRLQNFQTAEQLEDLGNVKSSSAGNLDGDTQTD